jgi:hypothetical protein
VQGCLLPNVGAVVRRVSQTLFHSSPLVIAITRCSPTTAPPPCLLFSNSPAMLPSPSVECSCRCAAKSSPALFGTETLVALLATETFLAPLALWLLPLSDFLAERTVVLALSSWFSLCSPRLWSPRLRSPQLCAPRLCDSGQEFSGFAGVGKDYGGLLASPEQCH